MNRARWDEAEAKFRKTLSAAKSAQRAHEFGPQKRRSNEFLAQFLSIPLGSYHALRSSEQYRAKSYNLSRQVLALIDHIFVRYRVPLFLYRSVLSYEGLALVFDDRSEKPRKGWRLPKESQYRSWFLTVAQGGSFAKAAKDVFNKKEAHWFLLAPPTNTVVQNIIWARAAAAGVPRDGCDYLVDRLDDRFLRALRNRLPDMLRFYATEWAKMRRYDRDEITDFIRAAVQHPNFSFKGRTFGSMRKLSHEWHRSTYAGVLGRYQSWAQRIPPWEFRKNSQVVRAIELTNNRALVEEGSKMCHCVYSYANRCIEGASRIVSVRWYAVASKEDEPSLELDRLTIEVSPQDSQIVQIRGRQNRRPTAEEMKVIRHWAGEQGLLLNPFAA